MGNAGRQIMRPDEAEPADRALVDLTERAVMLLAMASAETGPVVAETVVEPGIHRRAGRGEQQRERGGEQGEAAKNGISEVRPLQPHQGRVERREEA